MELGAKKLFKLSRDFHLTLTQGQTPPKSNLYGRLNLTILGANARALLLRGGYSLQEGDVVPHHNFVVNVFCLLYIESVHYSMYLFIKIQFT